METTDVNVEIPEELRVRRKSIQSEIEKVVQEKQKIHDEQEKVKQFTKSNVFTEIQKEVEQREEIKHAAQENKKVFSHDVLSHLPNNNKKDL